MHFDLPHLIQSLGYFGVWAIVFAESGLLVGFFLPGDSLLFTAEFLASQSVTGINIRVLIFGCFVCAVLGDNVGYATGHRFGRRLFQKEDSWLFHKKHLVTAQKFYEKHGKKAIVLARFMPRRSHFCTYCGGNWFDALPHVYVLQPNRRFDFDCWYNFVGILFRTSYS